MNYGLSVFVISLILLSKRKTNVAVVNNRRVGRDVGDDELGGRLKYKHSYRRKVMKKCSVITSTLVSAIILSIPGLAPAIQSDLEGDLLYGHVSLTASPSEVYVNNGPVQNGTEGDVLYHQEDYQPTTGFLGVERISDDRDISTSLIYGSGDMIDMEYRAGGLYECKGTQAVC